MKKEDSLNTISTRENTPKMLPTTKHGVLKEWMKCFFESISKKTLIELKLVGSHNSNSHSLDHHHQRIIKMAVCNDNTIYDQLCMGVRVLDLRYGNRDYVAKLVCPYLWTLEKLNLKKKHVYGKPSEQKEIVSRHGIVHGDYFIQAIEDIRQFLRETDKEFQIIKIKEENPLRTEQREYLIQIINELLGKYMITAKDSSWFDLKTTNYRQIVESNKRIFMFFEKSKTNIDISNSWNSEKFGCESAKDFGFFDGKDYQTDKWFNRYFPGELFEDLDKDHEMIHAEEKSFDKLRNYQLLQSPCNRRQYRSLMIAAYLYTGEMKKIAERLLKGDCLLKKAREIIDNKALNIISLDYVSKFKELIQLIIGSNNDLKLQVLKVVIDGNDLTKKFVNSLESYYNKKQNCQLLTKDHIDIYRRSYGNSMEIYYSFGDRICAKRYEDQKNTQKILLSYIDCISAEDQKIEKDDSVNGKPAGSGVCLNKNGGNVLVKDENYFVGNVLFMNG